MIVRTVETEVRCDHVGCHTMLVIESVMLLRDKKALPLMTYRRATVKARKHGWQIDVQDLDLCPEHRV